jgi:hypothetical protein
MYLHPLPARVFFARLIACACRYVGIIDFLQQWNLQKRAERNWKVTRWNVPVRNVRAHCGV